MSSTRRTWFEKFISRIIALPPGVYNLVLVIDDNGVKWSVQPVGKLEG